MTFMDTSQFCSIKKIKKLYFTINYPSIKMNMLISYIKHFIQQKVYFFFLILKDIKAFSWVPKKYCRSSTLNLLSSLVIDFYEPKHFVSISHIFNSLYSSVFTDKEPGFRVVSNYLKVTQLTRQNAQI